jgi:hypothetical protein
LVLPDPIGVLNQKNLFPTIIYQFEHFGTPYSSVLSASASKEHKTFCFQNQTYPFKDFLVIEVNFLINF